MRRRANRPFPHFFEQQIRNLQEKKRIQYRHCTLISLETFPYQFTNKRDICGGTLCIINKMEKETEKKNIFFIEIMKKKRYIQIFSYVMELINLTYCTPTCKIKKKINTTYKNSGFDIYNSSSVPAVPNLFEKCFFSSSSWLTNFVVLDGN